MSPILTAHPDLYRITMEDEGEPGGRAIVETTTGQEEEQVKEPGAQRNTGDERAA